jgi:hypothetical protein
MFQVAIPDAQSDHRVGTTSKTMVEFMTEIMKVLFELFIICCSKLSIDAFLAVGGADTLREASWLYPGYRTVTGRCTQTKRAYRKRNLTCL